MFQRRTVILCALFSAGFLLLVMRLVDLQVLRGDELREQGRQRIHRLVQVPPRRGRIRDRTGRVLARDTVSFDIWLVPARAERSGRKHTVASQVPGLSLQRMLRLALAAGATRELEYTLALRELQNGNPLVTGLSRIMRDPGAPAEDTGTRRRLARGLLDAILARNSFSPEALTRPRPWLKSVGRRVYLAVKQSRLLPGTARVFQALSPRLGSKRTYPCGALTAHIVGYVGRLTRLEYAQLRGYWQDGRAVPGTGVIRVRGRVFFSVLPEPDSAADTRSLFPGRTRNVEMEIIRLGERRRGNRVERYAGYFANEMAGRSGVERYYNQALRGRHGLRLLRLVRPEPHEPRRLRAVGTRNRAINGRDLVLTIDIDLQRRTREILRVALDGPDDHAQRNRYASLLENLQCPRGLSRARTGRRHRLNGVAILMDPYNGRIHAMVSLPDFDPNRLHQDFKRLSQDPLKPMLNHAIAGEYAPGSVMKPLVALAALSEGKILPDTEFLCEGEIVLGRRRYRCMQRIHHGHIKLSDALMVSCNVFFYQVGQALGPRRLYRWAWNLGLGHRTGIDLAAERPGALPYAAHTGRGWSLGNTFHLAIGQGPITVTPLQIAVAMAAIANGGRIVRPHVVLGDPSLDQPRAELGLDPKLLAVVRRGLLKVVQGDDGPGRRGTARRGRIPGIAYAGKTGSAEWRKGEDTHAWFACYAPYDKPEVVCVVMVPAGGHGGSTCAPIARRLLMDFFGIQAPAQPGEAGREAHG